MQKTTLNLVELKRALVTVQGMSMGNSAKIQAKSNQVVAEIESLLVELGSKTGVGGMPVGIVSLEEAPAAPGIPLEEPVNAEEPVAAPIEEPALVEESISEELTVPIEDESEVSEPEEAPAAESSDDEDEDDEEGDENVEEDKEAAEDAGPDAAEGGEEHDVEEEDEDDAALAETHSTMNVLV